MAASSHFANFVAFLSSVRDDLSNITSPPSFLAPQSVTELAACWAERPALFVAPTFGVSSERRCLAVLKWIISSHRRQFYIGENNSGGVRKPLNSFLGEIYREQWTDEVATTKLVSEQVSYQPSVTACYISSDEYGVKGDGFSQIEMSFAGRFIVRQTGYANLYLDQHKEHYLIQLPDIEIKGFLSGYLYPEISGTYHIKSTSGVSAAVTYSGEGLLSGEKNSFKAHILRSHDILAGPIFTMSGCWSDRFSTFDWHQGEVIEEWSHLDHQPAQPQSSRSSIQRDPWEASEAWHEVKSALKSGDLAKAMTLKLAFDRAQRIVKAADPYYESRWQPLFFTASAELQPHLASLTSTTEGRFGDPSKIKALWRYDVDKASDVVMPYHDGKGPAKSFDAVSRDKLWVYSMYDDDEAATRPLGTICESELPQQQRDFLRQRRQSRT